MELYIHIPYCARKCTYCDFASYPGREDTMEKYVDVLLEEAGQRAANMGNSEISTVFIGGGTPSLLHPHLLEKLLRGINTIFTIAPDAEFTSEANPGTLTEEWLKTAIDGGINRISMGMQAAQDELLRILGRIHTFVQVKESVELCRKAGFSNINLDIMFDLPHQTLEMWEETIDAALSLKPEHVSCYSLIIEENTPLKLAVDSGRLPIPDDELDRKMYDMAIAKLNGAGYGQYEISNFARPGFQCIHNLGYWKQTPYIGIGAAACSMLPDTTGKFACFRETNAATIDDYTGSFPKFQREHEDISFSDYQYETLMVGLRMTDGVSESDFMKKHGVSIESRFGEKLRRIENDGLLERRDGKWRLTREGLNLQNYVLVELMDD